MSGKQDPTKDFDVPWIEVALKVLGILTLIVNLLLNAILLGTFDMTGRSMDMKGGLRYSTRNSLPSEQVRTWINVDAEETYVPNSVPLTTSPLGLDPAMRMLLLRS